MRQQEGGKGEEEMREEGGWGVCVYERGRERERER